MDAALAPERDRSRILYGALSGAALGAIVYMASKTDLLSGVAHWVFPDTGNCDFDEYGRMRERILDKQEEITALEAKLVNTVYAPERARIDREIAARTLEKKKLETTYGHCSGWGNH